MSDRSTSLNTRQADRVTDADIKRELVDLLNVYGKLGTATPDEVKATIRAVSEGLAARGIRTEAYREAMTRFRIGACGRADKERAYAPVAPVIVAAAYGIECELRAAEYRQRKASAPLVFDQGESEPLTPEQQAKIDAIRRAIAGSTKPIPKEKARA